MSIRKTSLFADIPEQLAEELCQTLLTKPTIRIERIVSKGHITPMDEWYDQNWDEWVLLVSGQASMGYEDGSLMTLSAGDYLLIPAHCRHRVTWTAPDQDSVWLAIHLAD